MKYQIVYKPKGRIDPIEKIMNKDLYHVNGYGLIIEAPDSTGCKILKNQEDYEIQYLDDKKFNENKLYRGLTGGQVTIAEMIQEMESLIPESHRKYVKFAPKIVDNLDAMQWEYQLPDIKE